MAVDWAADVRKYAADADEAVIAGIVRYCGIALQKRDSSLVSFSDAKETDRVRNNFLKKKLGLTQADDVLDAAIAAVGARMKADKTKNRVTVYYLLAENFGMLGLFVKAAKAVKAGKTADEKAKPAAKTKKSGKAAAAGAAGGAALGLASLGDGAPADAASNEVASASGSDASSDASSAAGAGAVLAGAAAAVASGAASAATGAVTGAAKLAGDAGSAVADAAGAARLSSAASGLVGGGAAGGGDDDNSSALGWLWWLLLALLAIFLIWWLFCRNGHMDDAGSAAPAVESSATVDAAAGGAAAGAAGLAAAPAEGTVAIPAGAGVTSELRDGAPVVKVYFTSGKTEVSPDFAATATALKQWLDQNPGKTLIVSGYNDPSGNAKLNEQLSFERAKAVEAGLVAAGIPEEQVDKVKPENTTDASVDGAAARRVEVTIK